MIYIDNVVNVVFPVFQYDTKGCHVYNVCTGFKTTVQEVIDSLTAIYTPDLQVKYILNTPGHVFGIDGNNTNIGQELAREEATGFTAGIRRIYDWAVADPNK